MSASLIFSANEDDFSLSVIDASHARPVLVDFWADWCAPCRALAPVLERVTHAYGGAVRLAKVEVDENMRLAGRYGLRGFPTVILFDRGMERGRFSGARPEAFVRDFIDGHLG
ncbi:MAG: thioredoxin domain-containing protein [Gammaproteobacteria bacterium]|nr:thioredoxin domain-containing protein [Gammaproteobacteria bacterium]